MKNVDGQEFKKKTALFEEKWVRRVNNESRYHDIDIQDMMDLIFTDYFEDKPPREDKPRSN